MTTIYFDTDMIAFSNYCIQRSREAGIRTIDVQQLDEWISIMNELDSSNYGEN
jgi:hypothetical protein